MTTRLIFVGGFLGAGKTTLLWEAALKLSQKGLRVGLITNDQAPELVDTAFLSRGDASVNDYVMGNLTGKSDTLNIRGSDTVASEVRMTINALTPAFSW